MKIQLALATAKQQETAAFEKWFGKSKVVDANGKPLRVLHGTNASFDVFDIKHTLNGNHENGIGIYFTNNPSWSNGYTGGEGGSTMPVYLKIQKPIYYKKQPQITRTQIAKLMFRAGNRHVASFLNDNFDVPYIGLQKAKSEYIEMYEGLDILPASFGIYNDLYDGGKYPEMFAEIFKDVTGYDGVIVERPEGTNYVVFLPTQIKSAVGNAGTFKPRTADITK